VDTESFTDSSPSVVQEKEQGSIARRKRCSLFYGGDDGTGLLWFQIADDAGGRPFGGNR